MKKEFQEQKYYGKFRKVKNEIRGLKLVRVFMLDKEYTLREALLLLQDKQNKLIARIEKEEGIITCPQCSHKWHPDLQKVVACGEALWKITCPICASEDTVDKNTILWLKEIENPNRKKDTGIVNFIKDIVELKILVSALEKSCG